MPTATLRTRPKDECQLNGSVTFDCLFVECFLSFSVFSSAVLKLAVLELGGRLISSSFQARTFHPKLGHIIYRIAHIGYRISHIGYRIAYIVYYILDIVHHIPYIVYRISYIASHISYVGPLRVIDFL